MSDFGERLKQAFINAGDNEVKPGDDEIQGNNPRNMLLRAADLPQFQTTLADDKRYWANLPSQLAVMGMTANGAASMAKPMNIVQNIQSKLAAGQRLNAAEQMLVTHVQSKLNPGAMTRPIIEPLMPNTAMMPVNKSEGGLIDKVGSYLDNVADKASGNERDATYENNRQKSMSQSRVAPLEPLHKAHGGAVPNLNFKDFKKVHSDKHGSILRHPDGHELRMYAEGGDVSEQPPMVQVEDPEISQALSASPPNMVPGSDQLQPQAVPQQGPSNFPLTMPQQPEMPVPANMADANAQMMGGINQQQQGMQQQAQAEGQLGQQEQAIAQKQAANEQDLMNKYQQNVAGLEQERQAITQDIASNHIDLSRYMKSLSTSSQVSTAIGLILGGMGAGVTHGENPALKLLQANIDRDVQAQLQEASQKQNLLHSVQQQFGNMHDATSMLRIITADAYAAKLQQAAAASKNPMAIARADQAIGQLKMQTAPLMQQIAQRQTILQGFKSGQIPPEMAVSTLVPEPQQKEVFHEIKLAQDAQRMEKNALATFDKAASENTALKTGAGLLREPASVGALQALMLPLLKDNAGRVSEQEMHAMDKMSPKPGDSDHTIESKRSALHEFMKSKMSAPTAKGYGIDLQDFKSTKMMPNVRANPNAPRR